MNEVLLGLLGALIMLFAFYVRWLTTMFTEEIKLGREERKEDRNLREQHVGILQEVAKWQKENHKEVMTTACKATPRKRSARTRSSTA